MNRIAELLVPAAVASVVATIVSVSLGGAPAAEPPQTAWARAELSTEITAQLRELREGNAELQVWCESLSERIAAAESAARSAGRVPVGDSGDEGASGPLSEFAAALSGDAKVPEAFGEWIDDELMTRDAERREKRRAEVNESLNGVLADRIDELAERLELAPHQTTQVEGILSAHIAEVSSVIAEADSPIDIMRGIAPIKEARDTELQGVLTPEQFTSFQEQQSGFIRGGLPFGGGR